MDLLTSEALFERIKSDEGLEVYRYPARRAAFWMLAGGLYGVVLLWGGYQFMFGRRPSYDPLPWHVVTFALLALGTVGALVIAQLIQSLWTHREFIVDLHLRTLRMINRSPFGVRAISAAFADVADVRCNEVSTSVYAVQVLLRDGQRLELGQGPFEKANPLTAHLLTATQVRVLR